jgi:hypothetical protein
VWRVDDHEPLTLLPRLVVEIEDSIAQSRAVILSTRDAIELPERLEGRNFRTEAALLLLEFLAEHLQSQPLVLSAA